MNRLRKLRKRQRQKSNEWGLRRRKQKEYVEWQNKQITLLNALYTELLESEKRLKNSPQPIDKSEKH
tara:strand:- start:2128 stop:2328 length:201 start_codon:yes stop_codon:yes gene_type:complete